VQVVASSRLGQPESSHGALLWAVVAADEHDYQLLLAVRPEGAGAERAHGNEGAIIGNVGTTSYYDGTADPEMALVLLEAASGGAQRADRARPLVAEQSNTSIIYDDRLILKVFRRLSVGANPDVEVTSALAATGFTHIAKPLVRWQRDGRDLAFGQEYLAGGTDGWALALTSLRDYYGSASAGTPDPASSGGDFAAEAGRLGQMTGEMHLAMAKAFPTSDDLANGWKDLVDRLQAEVARLVPDLAVSGQPLLERLRAVAGPGPSVRAHGDFHLGQVMRTDPGWYVLDFEGEPDRPLAQRQLPTSVLKDVAGMLRSLQYAAQFALGERAEEGAARLAPLAEAWQERNSAAFLRGYYGCPGIEELLPPTPEDREAVRVAFELEKAFYELGYERSFRPGWAPIPMAALERLLTQPTEVLLAPSAEPGGTPQELRDDA